MKAIISIAALAMTFANVLAQELRGGPAVSTCLTFYRINLFAFSAPNKLSLHLFPPPISHFSRLDSLRWWVSTIDIILTPQVLSDVTTTDAGSEGRDWHPIDILEENDKTKFVVEGHKHYPKTKVVAGTHKADFLNNVNGQPYGNGNDENSPFSMYGDCMRSGGADQDVIDDAVDCLVEAWNDVPDGTYCNMLSEVGFCSAVSNCNPFCCGLTSQKKICDDAFDALVDRIIFHDGCSEDDCWPPYDNGNNENCPEEHPCTNDFGIPFGDCMQSEGKDQDVIDDVVDCLVEAWDDVPIGTNCHFQTFSEIGFCDAVFNCEPQDDASVCAGELLALSRCIIFHGGCDSTDFTSEDVCWDVSSSSKGRGWYPKTKMISDIVKENGEINLVSEGHNWYHKTKPIADILKQNNNTKLSGEGGHSYHPKTKLIADEDCPEQFPCNDFGIRLGDCLLSLDSEEKIDYAYDCIDEAWYRVPVGTDCDSFNDIEWYSKGAAGFCSEVLHCGVIHSTQGGYDSPGSCPDEVLAAARCLIFHGGCNSANFASEGACGYVPDQESLLTIKPSENNT